MAANLELFKVIFFLNTENAILCVLIRIAFKLKKTEKIPIMLPDLAL